MVVHTNVQKYTIFYTIMHRPQICRINKRLVKVRDGRGSFLYLIHFLSDPPKTLNYFH